jgi:fatty-acyl-CoA synthase
LLEAYYAVPQINAVLNPINIRLSQEEIEYIINHAGARVLCFLDGFMPMVERMRDNLPGIRNYVVMEPDQLPGWAMDYEELLDAASPQAEIDLDVIDENSIVELFYTSGTTGSPKGVSITNRSLYLHTLMAIAGLHISDADTMLHVVPLFHVNGWGTPHFLTAVGGKHVMLREIDYGNLLRLVEIEKVTRILGVPTIFNSLVNHPDIDRYDLSSLRQCIIGGAPSPPSLIDALEEKIGCTAIVGYGLTETTPLLTIAQPKSHLQLDEPGRRAVQVKTGLPVVGTRLRVVDQDGREVPADGKTMGEIVVRGNTVMDGYLNDQEATDNVIVDGWFHTGDVAVVDEEAYITIVDRIKDIIISGGENISSVEVEKVIQNHPAVFETVVIGVPDEKWGEVPRALVVLNSGAQVSEDELKTYIRAHLAGFKVPKKIEFRPELLKGGTGKIQKRELREPYWAELKRRIH